MIDIDKLVANGPGVLCQTIEEAKGSLDRFNERSKKVLVAVQGAGFGTVGWATSLRRVVDEIGVMHKIVHDGRTLWVAFERETDQDTLEMSVIRRIETYNEAEVHSLAKAWLAEYNTKKQAYFDAITKGVATPTPPNFKSLTKQEIEDVGKAKLLALQRQWPRCFELFEKQKSNPGIKIPDLEFEDAYQVDLVEQGVNLEFATCGEKIRPDMGLVAALHRASQNYVRRGKSRITDAAIYLIAFNWELGWCHLSDKHVAEKLSGILETKFTPGQVKQYRLRTLQLVAKHPPGPPPKIS